VTASVAVLGTIAMALDARLSVQLRWRAGELDRLLDAGHTLVSAAMVDRLHGAGLEARIEVTYSSPRASGSIDILAWHPATRALLLIAVKTEITSAEATLRKLDEKVRLAVAVARERFEWAPSTVSQLLAIEESATNRRRIQGAAALFGSALPVDGRSVVAWLANPSGPVAGRLFLSPSNGSGGIQARGGRHRVRRPSTSRNRPAPSVARDDSEPETDSEGRPPTILVGYHHPGY
jgi:hypothetical protein